MRLMICPLLNIYYSDWDVVAQRVNILALLKDSQFGHWKLYNGVTGKWGARGRAFGCSNF